jgi:hypothetical protein
MFRLTQNKEVKIKDSKFSRFFHEASSAEKKKVFMRVIKKASEEQRKMMNS